YSLIPSEVIKPLSLLLLLGVGYSLSFPRTAEMALLYNVFATSLDVVVGAIIVYLHRPRLEPHQKLEMNRASWVKISVPYLLLAGTQILNSQIDILMIRIVASQVQVVLYRVALQMSDGLGVVLFAISVVIAPRVARLYAQDKIEDLTR